MYYLFGVINVNYFIYKLCSITSYIGYILRQRHYYLGGENTQ
jgi:hypothetical protein